jgi:drug/metabolite transporter (DMT)-like permease
MRSPPAIVDPVRRRVKARGLAAPRTLWHGPAVRSSKIPHLKLVGAAALFSTGGAAIKSCEFTSWQVAGLRSAIAAVAFLAMVPAARRLPSARECLVGAIYAVTLVLFVLANKLTTAANTIFLQSTAPLYVLLLGPLFLKERIRARDLVFLLAMAAGLALFFLDVEPTRATAPDPKRGNWLALASGVGWAATVVGLRWLAPREGDASSGVGAVVAGNFMAAMMCAPFALPFSGGDASDWVVISYLGVFQIALAYVLVTSALRDVQAFEASVLLLVEPVMNPVWAWIVHGETPGHWALVGGAVILVSTLAKTWLDVRSNRRVALE